MTPREKVQQVIEKHNLVHIASLDNNGVPCVRGIDYASDEDLNLYFITNRHTRKVEQFARNNQVGFVIDHDCANMDALLRLKYIKGNGIVEELTTPEEMQQAMGLILTKFPYLKDLPFPAEDMKAYRLRLKEVLLTDNTVAFGHTEQVEL